MESNIRCDASNLKMYCHPGGGWHPGVLGWGFPPFHTPKHMDVFFGCFSWQDCQLRPVGDQWRPCTVY